MRTLTLTLLLTFGLAAPAFAQVPFSAFNQYHMRIDVDGCQSEAVHAIRSVTHGDAHVEALNENTRRVMGFTNDAVIVINCAAAPSTVCGRPQADVSIFVAAMKNVAASLRDALNTAIGDPILFDCG